MNHTLLAFILMSFPIWLVGSAIIHVFLEEDTKNLKYRKFFSIIIFLLPWWALYFLIT